MPEDQVKIKKEASSMGVTCCSDENYYPYGTALSFDDELVEELGVGNLARGDVVEVRGYAFVNSISSRDDEDGSHKSIRLQMTSMKIARETDDVAKRIYGDDS